MSSNQQDERRAAWKLDDPEWVKQRKKAWRDYKDSPVFSTFDKGEIKWIKTFFLTGIAFDPEPPKEEWNPRRLYHPTQLPLPSAHSLLIECWLDPEPSEERWTAVKSRTGQDVYTRTRSFFRGCFRDYNRTGHPVLFNGLDERLYYFFGPTRCRREDVEAYLGEISDDRYHGRCGQVYAQFVWQIRGYLEHDFNTDLIAPAFLDEWCDTIPTRYDVRFDKMLKYEKHRYNDIKDIVSSALSVIASPSDYDARQVEFAERMIARFHEMDLPRAFAAQINPLLGK